MRSLQPANRGLTAFRQEPTAPATDVALDIMLEDLAWWSHALEVARAQGEPPPAVFRMREAIARAGA